MKQISTNTLSISLSPSRSPYSSFQLVNRNAPVLWNYHCLIMEGQKFKDGQRSKRTPQNAQQTLNARDRMWIRMKHESTPLNVAPSLGIFMILLAAIERIRTNVSGLIFEILRRSDPRRRLVSVEKEKKKTRKNSSPSLAINHSVSHLFEFHIPSLVLLLKKLCEIDGETCFIDVLIQKIELNTTNHRLFLKVTLLI